MPTRFGTQPAQRFLQARGIRYDEAAAFIGVTALHLQQAVLGRIRPAPRVLERLPKVFDGMPIECLFNADVLAEPYDARKAGSQVRRGIKPNDNIRFSNEAIDAAYNYVKATEAE